MPRTVHVILCQLSLYVYIGTFYLIYKNGYVPDTVYNGVYTVGIRARFGWENFVGKFCGTSEFWVEFQREGK